MSKLHIFVLTFLVMAFFMISFRANAGYETLFCDGDFFCDAEHHIAVCNGTSIVSPSSSLDVDVSWEINKILLASFAGPIAKSWLFDPIFEHVIAPGVKWIGNKIRVFRKIASEEANIEETFLPSLGQDGIEQLKLINHALNNEEEWYMQPVTFNKEDKNYVIGYKYTGGRSNLYNVKIVGGVDFNDSNEKISAHYYKLKKNRFSSPILCHPNENTHPNIHPLPVGSTPLIEFTNSGKPANSFMSSFKNNVSRSTAHVFTHLLTSPNIVGRHYLPAGTHDNYDNIGEKTYIFFKQLPSNGGLSQSAAYLAIEKTN